MSIPLKDKLPVVIAIDPGNTTGLAAVTLVPNVEDEKHRLWPQGHSAIEIPGGIDGFSHHWANVLTPFLMEHKGQVFWLVERFNIDQRTVKHKIEYDALYIIGFIIGMVGTENVIFRNPADRRAAKKNLPEDWRNPSKDDHADDATAHLVTWLTQAYPYLMSDLLGGK